MQAEDNIIVNIDVTKIDKSRIVVGKKPRQDGSVGKYMDIMLIARNDQYGNNYMAVQSISKEERDRGDRGNILGNGKILHSQPAPPQPQSQQQAPPAQFDEDDEIPF